MGPALPAPVPAPKWLYIMGKEGKQSQRLSPAGNCTRVCQESQHQDLTAGGSSGSEEAMSPRGPRAALLLMFLMLTLMSSWPTADGKETQYEKFQRQHIDEASHPPFSDAYCNARMKKQKMTTPRCKVFNTFIHSDISTVKAVCTRTGTKRPNNRYYSNDSFYVTDCKFIRKDPRQGCMYSANTLSRRICITCEQVHGVGLAPVHYGKYKECFP